MGAIKPVFVVVGTLLWGCTLTASAKDPVGPPTPSDLDRIKQLAGSWEGSSTHGEETKQAKVVYRVTAGGSAVQETLFCDSDHEMVTMYYMDGGRLVLTHYCVLGNQPTMGVVSDDDPRVLSFACVGGTNIKSEDDPHMHTVRFQFVDDDHFRVQWTMHEKGQAAKGALLDLHRIAP